MGGGDRTLFYGFRVAMSLRTIGCQRDYSGSLCPHQPDWQDNWRSLARFYQDVFGCVPMPPEHNISGPEMAAGTGITGTHVRGVHLRLPGHGDAGPTLEIFSYNHLAERPPTAVNRPGFGHLAFSVEDVAAARETVLAAGGHPVGEVVTVTLQTGGRVTRGCT